MVGRLRVGHVVVGGALPRHHLEVLQVHALVGDQVCSKSDEAEREFTPIGIEFDDIVAKLICRAFGRDFVDQIAGRSVPDKGPTVSDIGQNFAGLDRYVLKLIEITEIG